MPRAVDCTYTTLQISDFDPAQQKVINRTVAAALDVAVAPPLQEIDFILARNFLESHDVFSISTRFHYTSVSVI